MSFDDKEPQRPQASPKGCAMESRRGESPSAQLEMSMIGLLSIVVASASGRDRDARRVQRPQGFDGNPFSVQRDSGFAFFHQALGTQPLALPGHEVERLRVRS